MQTLASQLSLTLMNLLLFSFDRDTRVEKTLMQILASQLSSSFISKNKVYSRNKYRQLIYGNISIYSKIEVHQ